MISDHEIEQKIKEWQDWRNIDHRLLNDGNPNKLAVSVDLYLMEERIDAIIREIKWAQLAKDDVEQYFTEFAQLVREYQERAYINILRGES